MNGNVILGGRIPGLDLFRVLCAFLIFGFHSRIHFECNYGPFNPFIEMGAIAMTAFFMLSGISLYISQNNRHSLDALNWKSVSAFLLKRFLGVIPVYYVTSILYLIILSKDRIIENIVLFPVELFCLQSIIPGLFTISHNSGTWFISCLIVCYIIFPFAYTLLKTADVKLRVIILVVFISIDLYTPLVISYFSLPSIYTNIFFRCLEFIDGIILVSIIDNCESNCLAEKHNTLNIIYRFISSSLGGVFSLVILIVSVSILYANDIGKSNYMLYNWIAIPCFSVFLVSALNRSNYTWCSKSKVLSFFCNISYTFFLAQFFTWKISASLLSWVTIESSILRIIVSFCVCTSIASLLHFLVEKPLKDVLIKK